MDMKTSPLALLKDPTLLKTDALINGEWVPLSGKAGGKHGLNAHVKLGDELHEWASGDLDDFVRKPEYGLGAHVAALGLAFDVGGERLGANFSSGAFIARHGSWNRTPPAGYDVVFIKFDANGNPLGLPVPVLTGFLKDNGDTRGRPTWVAFARDGALLVSDDTGGIIWRVVAPGAAPSPAIKPVKVGSLPPRRQLDGDPAQYKGAFEPDQKVREQ